MFLRLVRIRRLNCYIPACGSKSFDIFAVDEEMGKRGWSAGRVLEPPTIQLFFNLAHQSVVEEYLEDLAQTCKSLHASSGLRRTD